MTCSTKVFVLAPRTLSTAEMVWCRDVLGRNLLAKACDTYFCFLPCIYAHYMIPTGVLTCMISGTGTGYVFSCICHDGRFVL